MSRASSERARSYDNQGALMPPRRTESVPVRLLHAVTFALACLLIAGSVGAAQPSAPNDAEPSWGTFLATDSRDRQTSNEALATIARQWRDDYAGLIIDVARFHVPARPSMPDERVESIDPESAIGPEQRPSGFDTAPAGATVGSDIRRRLTAFLQRQTGQRFGDDLRAWRRWLWSRPVRPHSRYAEFKAELYARIDPRFRAFFRPQVPTTIRLDEIDWGGVPVNGIPPLRAPRVDTAGAATWLRDGHIVFGVTINGEARAYPRRILAWHEMALDTLGGVPLTIVYCTLCGTVIPYESTIAGRKFTFGTSGLLYRSNKLMFDEETASLWSSMDGTPVVGPLVGKVPRLAIRPVVTTTWGEWRRDHPHTTVLSLQTGFTRDYSEGAAYRSYFSTDRTMFETPVSDGRLRNKAEVVVLRPGALDPGSPPVALSTDLLRRRALHTFTVEGHRLVALTTAGGANRVFLSGAHTFSTGRDVRTLVDERGQAWTVTDDALTSADGERLRLVPTHRAFWFGWVAQHPDTLLMQ